MAIDSVKKFKVLIVLFFMFAGAQAFAQAGGGASATGPNGRFEGSLSGGLLGVGGGLQVDLAPAFYFKPLTSFDWLQIGGEIGYQKTSHRGGSTNNMAILAGITANAGGPVGSAFFLALGAALKSGSGGTSEDSSMDDPNGFGYHFLVGKRIPIAGAFVLKPHLGVISGGVTSFVFRPIAISFVF